MSKVTSHGVHGARESTTRGRIILFHNPRSSRLAYGSASQLQLADRLSSISTQFDPQWGITAAVSSYIKLPPESECKYFKRRNSVEEYMFSHQRLYA
jgi:hypothetical protein